MKKQLFKTQWHNTVVFAVLVPNEIDRNGDYITVDEITKTAHNFVINLHEKKVNIDHQKGTDIPTAQFVESYIAPVDISVDDTNVIPQWSRMVGIKFDDDMYQAILNGEYIGVSMEWYLIV